jgi:putative transposase
MIDSTAKLGVSRQAILLGISRGSIYYQKRPVSDADLKLMHRIRCPAGLCAANAERGQAAHEISLRGQPDVAGFAGARRVHVGRLHVATLMKLMGVEAIYRRPDEPGGS